MPRPTKVWALRRVAQVLALEAIGWARAPDSPTTAGLPRSPADITPQWLTAVLCRDRPDVRVASVTPLAGSAGTTTRGTLGLTYDAPPGHPGLPERLFVKCTSAVAQRLMLGLGGVIHGEPAFYAHVRPGLAIEAPAGYFGAVNGRTWRSVLLLEDVIHTQGARFWQPESRVTRGQIEDLLRQAAGWHGALWESPRLGAWPWLRTPAEQMRVIDALIGLADRRPAGYDRARAVIPPGLQARQAEIHGALRSSMAAASRGPQTYLHGDLHVANTYLTSSGGMGICDWQVGLRGSWSHDVAYLLATALDPEDRREWDRELLGLYLEHLAAAGGPPLSEDEAWLAYRRALLYPYFAWVYTLGRSRLQPQFQPDSVSLTMIGRIAAAIEDLDSLAALGR